MKEITILGSTGSIGTQVLDVVRRYPDDYKVVAMTAGKNFDLFVSLIEEFKPRYVTMSDNSFNKRLTEYYKYKNDTVVIGGENRLEIIGDIEGIDVVVAGIVGIDGLIPTVAAIKTGALIALANKEVMVAGGEIVTNLVQKFSSVIIPVDSEHSAIWQCLCVGERKDVSKLILTASGGAFRKLSKEELKHVTLEKALKHPNWNMGKKVTIDSATLMNKGLEVIEAMNLFGMSCNNIEVIVHPESIIHSMVQYKDNSVIAQMSKPSMIIPIQLALSYPERVPSAVDALDFSLIKSLNFEKADTEKFPCLNLAYEAAKAGGNMPVALNAADEIAVSAFISNKISFLDIPYYIEKVLNKTEFKNISTIDEVLLENSKAIELTNKLIAEGK